MSRQRTFSYEAAGAMLAGGMTQQEVADRFGVSRSAINNLRRTQPELVRPEPEPEPELRWWAVGAPGWPQPAQPELEAHLRGLAERASALVRELAEL